MWTEWPEANFFLLFLRIVSNSPAWPGPRRLSNAVVSALRCSAEGSVGLLRLLMQGAHDVCGRQADTQDVCCRLEKDVCGKLTQTSLLNALPACSTASPMLPPATLPAYDASQTAAPLSRTAPGAPETHPREKEASAEEAAAADAADIIKCAIQHLDIITLRPAYTQQPDRFRSRTRWLRGHLQLEIWKRRQRGRCCGDKGRIIRLQLSLGTKRCGLATQLVLFSPF